MRPMQFFYACAGVLMLAVAYGMGTRSATADFNERGFPIVGFSGGIVQRPAVLRADGTIWGYENGSWVPSNTPPIPIPISDVAHFDWVYLASKDGEVWRNLSTHWVSLGHVPAPTVNVEDATITDIKKNYREEEE